jgi:hypothetical protein
VARCHRDPERRDARSRFFAQPDGAFARPATHLEWDRSGTKPEIVGTSEIVDAVLAVYLRAQA